MEMSTVLNGADAAVLRKWARSYRHRWYALAIFAALAIMSGGVGVWNLAGTILAGRRMGLSAMQTLLGSPTVEPADAWRLLAMAFASYLNLGISLSCIPTMLFILNGARRYRVVLKLLPRDRKQPGPGQFGDALHNS